jgi:exosortase/archaeosortase family protein
MPQEDVPIRQRLNHIYWTIRSVLTRYLELPACQAWLARLTIVVPSLVVLAIILVVRLIFAERGAPLPDQALYALPVPLAFLLWLYTWDKGSAPLHRHSSLLTMLTYPMASAAVLVAAYPPWTPYRFAITFASVIATLLAHADIARLCNAIRREPVAAILSLLLASILYLHAIFHELLWSYLCAATANAMMAIASLVSFPAEITTDSEKSLIYFGTFRYKIMLAPPCSGMDGIALFFALLTVSFLFDWKMFRQFPFLRLYLAGFLMIFLVNTLRITVLFSVGFIGGSVLPTFLGGFEAAEDEQEFFHAAPQGLPAGPAVAFSPQVTTQTAEVFHEFGNRHRLGTQLFGLPAGTLSHFGQRLDPLGWHHVFRTRIRSLFRQRSQP